MVHAEFELNQYMQDLYHEVQSLVYSDEDGSSKEDKFTEYVMEQLAEAGETESIQLSPYVRENKLDNIQYKINGYGIEEGYETLDIFITHFEDTNILFKVQKADFDKLIKWPIAFLTVAFNGIFSEIEPSTTAHGLAELIFEKAKEIVRVNIFILSNGIISHDPPKNISMKKRENISIRYHIWDIERLHRLAQSKFNREPIEINFLETLHQPIPCLAMPSTNDLYECYLAIVPGSVLANLYKNHGTRLLESNVRAFLQQTGKINKGIRDTIKNEPFMFLPYNNGLATTAQEVTTKRLDDGQLVITGVKDFQIVNGGQTTASLFHTQKKYKADLSKVFVQMKLTVIKDEEKKNETVPFISRYANSQNKVSDLDLTSNSPFLQKIEELSRTTYAIDPSDSNKQTLWFFERVKGQYKESLGKEPTNSAKDAFKLKYPQKQVIIKPDIAKYFNIMNLLPYHVAKGAQKNYIQFLKDNGKEFKKNMPGRVFWQDIVANAILFKTVDKLFGRKNDAAIGDTSVKSLTVAYTLSFIHHHTKKRLNLGMIWNTQTVPEDLVPELKKCLVFVYGFLENLNAAMISEAAKSEKTWSSLLNSTDNPMNMTVVNKYLLSEDEFTARYKYGETAAVEDLKHENLRKITSLGPNFWDGLYQLNKESKILTEYQELNVLMIRKALINAKVITDKLIVKGAEIIDLLLKEGKNMEVIANLSKIGKKESTDTSLLYESLSSLDDDQWRQIFSLGSQHRVFSLNEISVMKTVYQKIRHREAIDLKRLKITRLAIDRLQRIDIK